VATRAPWQMLQPGEALSIIILTVGFHSDPRSRPSKSQLSLGSWRRCNIRSEKQCNKASGYKEKWI